MGRKAKEEKPALPTTYREWAIGRIKQRISKTTLLEIKCSTRRLINVPKYLYPALATKEERLQVGERELRKLRDEGLFVCTDGFWWNRQERRAPLPQREVHRGEYNSVRRDRATGRELPKKKSSAKPAGKQRGNLRLVKG